MEFQGTLTVCYWENGDTSNSLLLDLIQLFKGYLLTVHKMEHGKYDFEFLVSLKLMYKYSLIISLGSLYVHSYTYGLILSKYFKWVCNFYLPDSSY